MTLSELLRKYAKAKGARVPVPEEDTDVQPTAESGELFQDVKSSAVFQKILSVFPGARVVETKKFEKE